MATSGELRSIIEELELVDAGDAASYLGEEHAAKDEAHDQRNAEERAGIELLMLFNTSSHFAVQS